MSKMIKLAIGLAALGFVGLIGLGTMSILWAIAAPHPYHRQVAGEQVPARVVDTQDIDRAAHDSFNSPAEIRRSVQSNWARPAQIQVNVHDSWIDTAGSFAGLIILFGLPAIIFIVIRFMRRGRSITVSDETALVHELARRAQDLSQRMEALETILLDRTRATR